MKYKLRQTALAVPAIASGLLFTALPSSVMAESVPYKLVDTTNAPPETGTKDSPISYTGDGDYAALHIIGNGNAGEIAYEGTWLTLTGDPSAPSNANSGMAANVSAGGELRLYNSTLVTSTQGETTATWRTGIRADASTVYVENSNITTNSIGITNSSNNGVRAANGSSIELFNTDITTYGHDSAAVLAGSSSHLEMTGGTVETFGISTAENTWAHGFQFSSGSTGTVADVTIRTHSNAARGVSVNAASANVSGLNITTEGDRSPGFYVEAGGTLIADNVTINASGLASNGIALGWDAYATDTKISVKNSEVHVTGENASALRIAHSSPEASTAGNFILEVNGGTYTSAQSAGLMLVRTLGDTAGAHKITIADAQVTGPQSIHVEGSSDATIEIGENSKLTGDVTFEGTSETTLTLAGGTTLTGNVHASDSAQVSILLEGGSVLTGSVTRDDNNPKLDLGITGSTWTSTGSSTVHDLTLENATLNLTLDNLTDAITVDGTLKVVTGSGNESTVFVDLSNSLLSEILGGTGNGTAVINVFDLITGSETFVGEDDALLNYTVLGKNAAGSTYTVQYLEEGRYQINGIVLAAVPEPATCAALAGLTLLAYALLRRRH
jgi:autotransporter family porin